MLHRSSNMVSRHEIGMPTQRSQLTDSFRIFANQTRRRPYKGLLRTLWNFAKIRWQLFSRAGEGILLLLIRWSTVGSYPSDQTSTIRISDGQPQVSGKLTFKTATLKLYISLADNIFKPVFVSISLELNIIGCSSSSCTLAVTYLTVDYVRVGMGRGGEETERYLSSSGQFYFSTYLVLINAASTRPHNTKLMLLCQH